MVAVNVIEPESPPLPGDGENSHAAPPLAGTGTQQLPLPAISLDDSNLDQPLTCPLTHVKPGTAARIDSLRGPAEVTRRLREIGLLERQVIKLVIRQANVVCQVRNSRLAISSDLARLIIVRPLPGLSPSPFRC